MRSPSCGFTKRLIVLSICLCGLLAFSSTLSADPATFVVGQDNLGSYTPNNGSGTNEGVSMPVGPYAGVLTINGKQSPNYLYFCLTGNQYLDSTENGTEASVPASTLATTQQLEEAAFLASLTLTDAAQDKITLTSTNGSTITFTANGSTSTGQFISSVLGPIQDAIWYVMGTLPSGDSTTTILKDPTIAGLVSLAQTNYMNYTYNNDQVFTYVLADNQSWCPPQTQGQSFISVTPLTPSVPEPGTMVLFGAGALLMGLGCARRRLAKRPR
jgi:hypothetical protein